MAPSTGQLLRRRLVLVGGFDRCLICRRRFLDDKDVLQASAAERARDEVEIVIEQIGVCVEGHCSRCMAEHALDSLDVRARADGQTRCSVAKIVGSDVLEAGVRLPRTFHRAGEPAILRVRQLHVVVAIAEEKLVGAFARHRSTDGEIEKVRVGHLSERLRLKGWLVPAYPMPDDLAPIVVQRIVVRNGLSRNLAESLLSDIVEAVEYLDALESPMPTEGLVTSFTH